MRPRFLADEDLRFAIVSAARRLEPALEIITTTEAALKGAPDFTILDYAHQRGLLIISHDVSTLRAEAERRVLEGVGIAGVLLAPQSEPTRLVAESLVLIWAASEAEEWIDRIAFIPV